MVVVVVFALVKCFASVHYLNTKQDTSCMFSQTGSPWRVIDMFPCRNIEVKCLSRERNNVMSSSVIKPAVDKLAFANLGS